MGCFPDLAKSIFIMDTQAQEEMARREFAADGMEIIFVLGSRYLKEFWDSR